MQPECVKLYVQCGYDGYWPFGCTFTSEESEIIADHLTDIETYRDEMYPLHHRRGRHRSRIRECYLATLDSPDWASCREVYAASYARYLER